MPKRVFTTKFRSITSHLYIFKKKKKKKKKKIGVVWILIPDVTLVLTDPQLCVSFLLVTFLVTITPSTYNFWVLFTHIYFLV